MANQVSNLLNYAVGVFDNMPLVNTIVLKDDDVIDVEKENIYPLVTIQLKPYPAPEWNAKQLRLAFEVHNQRDDRKIATPNKLMTDTNYIDNIGICDSIANNFVMEVMKAHNDYNIEIIEVSEFEPVRKDERNCLDGIKFEVVFLTPQNEV